MTEQTRVFNEMTAIINDVVDGADPDTAAGKIAALGKELKSLKIQLSELESIKEKDAEQILDLTDFSEATVAYQKARSQLALSGKNTLELERALSSHHNPAPMPGEGTPE